ncbi:MAG TPA: hypothetical protein VJG83_04855 [archaeon]|nr:hypothetical protein [archaeon]
MYQKTVEREEGYSKEQLARISKSFTELKKFKNSPSVMAYLKKRKAELKAEVDL